MDVKRMHAEVKLRYNKLNSNHKPDLPTAFIDDLLNDAQNEFVEICYSGNNAKRFKLGFEFTQQRMDMLSSLVIPEEDAALTLFKTNIYRLNLDNLIHKYRNFVSGYVNSSCGKLDLNIIRHSDLEGMLINANTKPSKVWKRCLATMVGNTSTAGNQSMLVYTGGEFTPTNITITYLKEPRKMFFGGYNTLEYSNGDTSAPSSTSPQINCELPDTGSAHTLIVDIAIQLIARSLEDLSKIQITEDKITRTI
jgi:hypothetical protein